MSQCSTTVNVRCDSMKSRIVVTANLMHGFPALPEGPCARRAHSQRRGRGRLRRHRLCLHASRWAAATSSSPRSRCTTAATARAAASPRWALAPDSWASSQKILDEDYILQIAFSTIEARPELEDRFISPDLSAWTTTAASTPWTISGISPAWRSSPPTLALLRAGQAGGPARISARSSGSMGLPWRQGGRRVHLPEFLR